MVPPSTMLAEPVPFSTSTRIRPLSAISWPVFFRRPWTAMLPEILRRHGADIAHRTGDVD